MSNASWSTSRLARAPSFLLVGAAALVAAGWLYPSTTTPSPSTPCGFSADLKNVPPQALQSCAKSVVVNVDLRHGDGGAQHLTATDVRGNLVKGPYASVRPLREFMGIHNVTEVTERQLQGGVPLAVIHSDAAYARLGLQEGDNVVVVSVREGASTGVAAVVSVDGSSVTYLPVHVTTHDDPADYPLPTARWITGPHDNAETIWIACGRKCCWVMPNPDDCAWYRCKAPGT